MGAATLTSVYLSGDAGNDTISATILKGSTVYGGNSTGSFADGNTDGGDTFTSTQALAGSFVQGNAGNDALTVSSSLQSSTIRGGSGNDTISAGLFTTASVFGDLGADSISIGTGNNQVRNVQVFGDNNTSSEGGNDTITLTSGTGLLSLATVTGGAGNDTLSLVGGEVIGLSANGNAGADTYTINASTSMISSTIYGGQGNDVMSLTSSSGGVFYGDAGADSIAGNVSGAKIYGDNSGTSGNDTFTTSAAQSATVYGGGGADVFNTSAGGFTTSTLYGGAGNDSFTGYATGGLYVGDGGQDTLGFTDIDTATVLGGAGADTVGTTSTRFDTASVVGGSGNDLFSTSTSASSTFFFGFGSGADTITATAHTVGTTVVAISATYGATGSLSSNTVTFGTGNTLQFAGLASASLALGTQYSFVTVSQASIDSLG